MTLADPLVRIYQRIEANWEESGAWPDLVQVMRQAIQPGRTGQSNTDIDPIQWALLPGTCCQAAGGDPLWADDLAAAWLLMYVAAHLMDSVEDQDEPDAWWAEAGAGVALNVATGLFFSASYAINKLYSREHTRPAAAEIVPDFYRRFLNMTSGQFRDITLLEPTLEQYWQISKAKSGAFFGLACRSGARLATGDPERVDGFYRFGNHIGSLIQILDDLKDVQIDPERDQTTFAPGIGRSLPVAYALEVLPPGEKSDLRYRLQAACHDPQSAKAALQLIEDCGAGIYLALEIERHKHGARSALSQAKAEPPGNEQLSAFLEQFEKG